tara:strand:+ start:129 stop:800 length:672 start_codon:yes stop_codon:yes gene_type:complete
MSTANNLKFNVIGLGQTIMRYQVPLEVFIGLNEIYNSHKKKLPHAGKQLAGKIRDEVSLFYSGTDTTRMHPHNFLPADILKWFYSIFEHYLQWNRITKGYTMDVNSVWVNEMRAGDYNPVHTHQGKLHTGLSSVMILKLPKDMGPEIARPDQPLNGQLQILGNIAGQFAVTNYSPKVQVGDFYVFPYDIRHVVYPFYNKKEKRRTLACNCDVAYDPITSGVAQ